GGDGPRVVELDHAGHVVLNVDYVRDRNRAVGDSYAGERFGIDLAGDGLRPFCRTVAECDPILRGSRAGRQADREHCGETADHNQSFRPGPSWSRLPWASRYFCFKSGSLSTSTRYLARRSPPPKSGWPSSSFLIAAAMTPSRR